MNYRDELTKAMELLGKDERTLFIGQTAKFKGTAMYGTLERVPLEKRIEMPIMEDVQMGMATGLALGGYIPISIFPRFDFLVLATNQLVNQLDKTYRMSKGDFNPRVIIRTSVGSTTPLNGGPQHTQDHTEAYRRLVENVDIVKLTDAKEIVSVYQNALNSNRSTLIVEMSDLYNK